MDLRRKKGECEVVWIKRKIQRNVEIWEESFWVIWLMWMIKKIILIN